MSSSFLNVGARSLALCVAFAPSAGCGRDSTDQIETPEAIPATDAEVDGDERSDTIEAAPRHYAPGVFQGCLSDARVVVEPDAGSADEPDAGAVQDPDAADAGAVDEPVTEAGSDDVSVADASVADVSVTDDAAEENTGDEIAVDASAGDETIGDESAGDEVSTAAAVEPGDPGPADVIFTIRADRGVHPISPLIYGTNDRPNFVGNGMGLLRSGGNRWTAFNWENGASNAGKDFKYQNDDNLTRSDAPGGAVLSTIKTAIAYRALPLVTVPIVNFVAYDKTGDGDVRMTPDYLATRFKENLPTKQAAFSPAPDATDPYVYQDEFVSWAKGIAAGSPVAFSLDNEPDLWASTHPEVHPNKVTYDELVSRDIDFALAIKNVWPEAKVFGFVSYGWSGFTTLQGAPDADEKGDFIEYYLDKMMEAECFHHRRLIDYLDLHWYSEIRAGRTRVTSAQVTAPVVEARLQAPRSLWDPTFIEDTWITAEKGDLGSVPIALIPRMLEKIRIHYPGTELSISEWTYGAGTDISGALATADALGIFGKTGLGAAAIWPLNLGPFTWAGFRAFRNFDGQGAAFGDTSIEASTSDNQASSVYASVDSAHPERVVIMAINKDLAEKSAAILVAHEASFSSAAVYTLTSAAPQFVPAAPLTATASNGFLYSMPPRSISVLVLAP